ncbi:hypothetical protein [Thiomonas sp.]
MLVKEIGGLLMLAFIVWIFLTPEPTVRIERACAPIGWGGNVATSLAALSTPKGQFYVQQGMDKMTYGCEYAIWRLFYQAQYNQYQMLLAAHPNLAQSTAATASAASVAPPANPSATKPGAS